MVRGGQQYGRRGSLALLRLMNLLGWQLRALIRGAPHGKLVHATHRVLVVAGLVLEAGLLVRGIFGFQGVI